MGGDPKETFSLVTTAPVSAIWENDVMAGRRKLHLDQKKSLAAMRAEVDLFMWSGHQTRSCAVILNGG